METSSSNLTDCENKGTILVVDDEEAIRALMGYALRRAGYKTYEAAGPVEAQSFLDAGHKFDLLLTDFQMPEMNGVELAVWFQAVQPGVPVLIVTGTPFKVREYLEREEIYPCLPKPFKTSELISKVAEVIATRVKTENETSAANAS